MPKRSSGDAIQRGFTLVELLIVIVILGILAGIVVFAVGNVTSSAKTTGCNAEKTTISHALEAYKSQTGSYPTAAAAGGGSHTAMDLLTGNATTTPSFGTLLKKVPGNYTINDTGAITAIASNGGGCT